MFSRTDRPEAPKRGRLIASSFALVAATAFVLVSVVDPTTGTFAETASLESENVPGQDVAGVDGQSGSAAFSEYVIASPTPTPTPTPTPSETQESTEAAADDASEPAAVSIPTVAAPDPGSAQAVAHEMVLSRGWDESEYACLVNLWNRESGWNVYASNPSSGAYGIPQALPGSKMGTVGADWQTNAATQITWGLGYISERYGTPCGAWGHSESVGWY